MNTKDKEKTIFSDLYNQGNNILRAHPYRPCKREGEYPNLFMIELDMAIEKQAAEDIPPQY